MNVFSVAFGSTTDRSVIIGTIAKIIYVTNFESASPVFHTRQKQYRNRQIFIGQLHTNCESASYLNWTESTVLITVDSLQINYGFRSMTIKYDSMECSLDPFTG